MSRTLISFSIWLAAALAAGALWWHTRGPHEPFPGVAGEVPTPIASTAPGRVAAIPVQVGDVVEAGALVAQLDPAEAEAGVEVARAELAAALAEVEAETVRAAMERRRDEIDLLARSVQARAAIDDAQARRSAAQAEFRSLSGALGRMRGVSEAGLVRGDQVADLESRRARVQGEASYGPEALEAWRDFTTRLDGAMKAVGEGEAVLGPLRARVDLARRQVDARLLVRLACDIKAPQAGRVSRVLVRPGVVVAQAQAILELVEPDRADTVMAWLPEERSRLLAVGSEVLIIPRDRHAEGLTGQVERLGPALELLPQRLWITDSTPRYGRPVLVKVNEVLLPGEAVLVAPR